MTEQRLDDLLLAYRSSDSGLAQDQAYVAIRRYIWNAVAVAVEERLRLEKA